MVETQDSDWLHNYEVTKPTRNLLKEKSSLRTGKSGYLSDRGHYWNRGTSLRERVGSVWQLLGGRIWRRKCGGKDRAVTRAFYSSLGLVGDRLPLFRQPFPTTSFLNTPPNHYAPVTWDVHPLRQDTDVFWKNRETEGFPFSSWGETLPPVGTSYLGRGIQED